MKNTASQESKKSTRTYLDIGIMCPGKRCLGPWRMSSVQPCEEAEKCCRQRSMLGGPVVYGRTWHIWGKRRGSCEHEERHWRGKGSVARACRGFQGKIPLSDPKLHIWITSTAKESYGSTHQLPGSKSPCSEDTILCSEPSAECKFVPSSNSQVSINRGNIVYLYCYFCDTF